MLPDFNRLYVFFHIYRCQGVGAAARQLHITQSAVSQHLRKLEAELGSPLFLRVRGRIQPTEAAHKLFAIFSSFVGELEMNIAGLHGPSERVQTLRVGAPVEFGAQRLVPLIAKFRTQHPGVRFDLRLGHPWETLPSLEQGRLDLALADVFSAHDRKQRSFSVEKLIDESLLLVGSKRAVAKLDGDHSLAGLLQAQFIAYREGAPALQSWFRHHFNKSPLWLDVVLNVESVQAVMAAVRSHAGLGVVPAHVARAALARGGVVEVRGRKRRLNNRISLVRALDKVPTPSEKAFVRFLKNEVE